MFLCQLQFYNQGLVHQDWLDIINIYLKCNSKVIIKHPKKRNELLDEQFEKPNDLKILTLTLFKSRQIAIIWIDLLPTVEFQTPNIKSTLWR